MPFVAASLSEVRDFLLGSMARGDQRLVVTANTDHVVRLHRRPDLDVIYRTADVVADGMPLVWSSRWLGDPLPERVTGVDLMRELCRSMAAGGGAVFLLGSTEATVEAAAENLRSTHPGLEIRGTHHGYFDGDAGKRVVDAISGSGADALFVGMSSPRQELWALEHMADLHPRLIVCVGGSFEVIAGTRRRAPMWMQRSGLEWTYRLIQEPRRLWRRYLIEDASFLPILAREWRARRNGLQEDGHAQP